MLNVAELFEVGTTSELYKTVEIDDAVGDFSPDLEQFLSTSACVRASVLAAMKSTEDKLPEGYITVGRVFELEHLEPTLLGTSLVFRATLKSINGNKLFFEIVAEDGLSAVFTARHERAVVNKYRLMDRATERTERIKAES